MMQRFLKTRFSEVQKLQNCDLALMMGPLKIIREETRIGKADLQRLCTRLIEESNNSNYVEADLFFNSFVEAFGENTADN